MSEILPIGTVVLLEDSDKKAMIIGMCQQVEDGTSKIWDYAGVPFPEGYLGNEYTFVFDRDQIQDICHLGLQDEEQMEFNKKIEEAIEQYWNEDTQNDEDLY